MGFTVKEIFPKVDMDIDSLLTHRLRVGINVKSSWMTTRGKPLSKIKEDGFAVCLYPDDFKIDAKRVVKRYLTKYNLVVKKRRRIISQQTCS